MKSATQTIYATPKFDVGKVISPPHLPLKPDANSKNNDQEKFQFTYKIK